MTFLGFWIREIFGWVLVFAGLYTLYMSLALMLQMPPRFVQASSAAVIGIIVFRGGIHLLKVAVAARIALRVRREVRKQVSLPKTKRTEVSALSGGALPE